MGERERETRTYVYIYKEALSSLDRDKYMLIMAIGQYVVNGRKFGVRARELQSVEGGAGTCWLCRGAEVARNEVPPTTTIIPIPPVSLYHQCSTPALLTNVVCIVITERQTPSKNGQHY